MQNKNISFLLSGRFTKIRDAVQQMQDGVIKEISRCADINSRYVTRYNTSFLAQKQQDLQTETSNRILKIKDNARRTINEEFSGIRSTLRDWTRAPLPEECALLLSAYTGYSITPTRAEVEALAESAQGSYIGSRIVSELATKAGLDLGFRLIEDYDKSLLMAQSDVLSVIDNFKGFMSGDFKYVSDMLGLDICNNTQFAVMAEEYMSRETGSFFETEKELCRATETKVTILPSKRAIIDDLFRDQDDAGKVSIIKDYIEAHDYSMTGLLEAYDKDLYNRAINELSDARRAEAEHAIKARQEASRSVSEALRSVSEIDAIQNRTTA